MSPRLPYYRLQSSDHLVTSWCWCFRLKFQLVLCNVNYGCPIIWQTYLTRQLLTSQRCRGASRVDRQNQCDLSFKKDTKFRVNIMSLGLFTFEYMFLHELFIGEWKKRDSFVKASRSQPTTIWVPVNWVNLVKDVKCQSYEWMSGSAEYWTPNRDWLYLNAPECLLSDCALQSAS